MRSKYEKETIILFNEGEDEARIYTHNARMKSKLIFSCISFTNSSKFIFVSSFSPLQLLSAISDFVFRNSPFPVFHPSLLAVRLSDTDKIFCYFIGDGKVFVKGLYSQKKDKEFDAYLVLDDTGEYVNFKLEFPKRGD